MGNKRDPGQMLYALGNALADAAEHAPDAELLADARAAPARTEAVRTTLLDALKAAKKKRLAEATAAHSRAVLSLKGSAARLPSTPAARRALLHQTLNRRPELRVTVQFRDFDSLTDANVDGLLEQFSHLGILDEGDGNGE